MFLNRLNSATSASVKTQCPRVLFFLFTDGTFPSLSHLMMVAEWTPISRAAEARPCILEGIVRRCGYSS